MPKVAASVTPAVLVLSTHWALQSYIKQISMSSFHQCILDYNPGARRGGGGGWGRAT
jgi:hypothetical protein